MPRGLFGSRRRTFERQSAIRSGARSIHRDFTHQKSLDMNFVAGPEYLEKWALALLAEVEKSGFLLCSKFMLTVIHNIITHPEKKIYRRMQTSSRTVKAALETEAAQRLLDFIGLQKQGDMYVLEGDLSHDDTQRLQWLEEALTNTRKKLYVLEAWELFVQDIDLGSRIGAGSFGDVHEGTYRGERVAIKTLKANTRPEMREAFFQEADIMKNFKHPNVLGLIGVVMRKKPNVIVMAMMETNLQDLLRSEATVLGDSLTKAMEVAAGLEYIHHQNIIHCDLAARNILVTDKGLLKIADFGLARAADSDDCDVSNRPFPIPVRWSAPEVWQRRVLSKKTDIWSFGVVFYEIMTAGAVPYVQWKNAQVKVEVADGYRLPCPAECPKEFHEVMMKTWKQDPEERPSCNEIVLELVKVKTQMADKLAEKRRLKVLERQLSEEQSVASSPGEGTVKRSNARRGVSGLGPFTFFMQNMQKEQQDEGETEAEEAGSSRSLPAIPEDKAKDTTEEQRFQEPLSDTAWYHGRRSTKHIKEVTEPMLKQRGDFMVHETRIPGEYVLSVMWRIPLHIRLVKDRRGIIECGEREFTSIADLVQHHVGSEEPIVYGSKQIVLRRAIDRDDSIEGDDATDASADDLLQSAESVESRRDHQLFISYQVETEGALARNVYDALQSTDAAGSDLICFLDQYDLSQAPGVDPWSGGIRSAILSAKVFLVLISENALSLTQTKDFDGTLILQLAMAVNLHKQQKIQLVPVFVGRSIQINHPTKPHKTFTVFDSYDLFDASQFPDDPVGDDTQMTTREVLDYIFSMKDQGFIINPEEDDLQQLCNEIVRRCLEADPELLGGSHGGSGDATPTNGATTTGALDDDETPTATSTGTASTATTTDCAPQYLSDSSVTRIRLSRRRRTRWQKADTEA